MRYYRALISVPISAKDDEEALGIAFEHANTLRHPNSSVIAGHVELLSEGHPDGGLHVRRTVYNTGDGGLLDQLSSLISVIGR